MAGIALFLERSYHNEFCFQLQNNLNAALYYCEKYSNNKFFEVYWFGDFSKCINKSSILQYPIHWPKLIVFEKWIILISVVAANQQMRSTTNLLIINLAAADILFVIFCVPFTATDYVLPEWPFGDLWCKVVSFMDPLNTGILDGTNYEMKI